MRRFLFAGAGIGRENSYNLRYYTLDLPSSYLRQIPIRAVEIIINPVFQSFAPKPLKITPYRIISTATMYVIIPFDPADGTLIYCS